MKRIVSLVLIVALLVSGAIALTACQNTQEFEALDATDLMQEDFGIAIKKGNTTLMTEVNNVINEWIANGNMDKYMDYYEALASEEEGDTTPIPTGLKTTWDFGTATETITVYTESGFAPYEFIYNNVVVGLDVALMSEVAVNMGKKIKVEDVAFDNIPTLVSSASGDAVGAAGLTINADRKEIVDFSNVYTSSTLVIVSKKGSGLDSVAKLAGKIVGVQQGTSGDLIISAAIESSGFVYEDDDENEIVVKAAGATVKQYAQYSLVLQDLKNGRIDAILMDKIPAMLLLASMK